MSLCLLLFSYLICLSVTKEYDFNLTVKESKLLTWTDSNGKSQQLLLSQLQIVEKTVLVKKFILPYSYLVE